MACELKLADRRVRVFDCQSRLGFSAQVNMQYSGQYSGHYSGQ
jgi:hypothetical protein